MPSTRFSAARTARHPCYDAPRASGKACPRCQRAPAPQQRPTHTDALYEVAESGCAASPPLVHVDPENPDDTPLPPPLPPRPRAQFNSVAVRLGSNRLRSLEGLRAFLEHVLDSPEQLAWLDVSCNQLERVDTVLQDYPNLKVRALAPLCRLPVRQGARAAFVGTRQRRRA